MPSELTFLGSISIFDMSKYYSFGSCVVAVDHQCWCEGSAYQKQQGRASWDIYVTFTPRRGISPLRPSLLVPEPRLLLKLVTRIAAFPILESIGSEGIIFLVSSKKSLWKIWNPIIATCLDEAKVMHCEATGSDELEVGKPERFASPTNYQAA